MNLPNLLKTAPLALMAGAVKDLLLLPFARSPPILPRRALPRWIQSHFGRTLYRQFFEGYTGKLWGINPDQLSADWAGQRISLIDLKDVARRLLPRRNGGMSVRTYARKYRYPKYGFGQIFTTLGGTAGGRGQELKTGATITRLEQTDGRIERVYWSQDDVEQSERFDQVISPCRCRSPASIWACRAICTTGRFASSICPSNRRTCRTTPGSTSPTPIFWRPVCRSPPAQPLYGAQAKPR